jgi:hypothetical protein
MAEMVLPQLIQAEAQLAAEEAALAHQLAEIQEKIKGIQTVIAMFDSSVGRNGKVASSVVMAAPVVEEEEPVVEVEEVFEAVEAVEEPEIKPARATKSTRGRRAKASTPIVRKATPARKVRATPKTTKRVGKSSNWQSYVRPEFGKSPLPDVVENILKAKPKAIFKIADVMAEIFPEDIPQTHFLKARNRISNILSAGARSGEWYRGRGGTYSCSEKALKAS